VAAGVDEGVQRALLVAEITIGCLPMYVVR
jgi:hypothetical protein